MTRKERTLKRSATMEGVALHSGETVQVQIEPAPAGTGVIFRRGDRPDPADIPALAGHLAMSQRRTVLREAGSVGEATGLEQVVQLNPVEGDQV